VTKEKLNLFEFASGLMAETGASATKIVGYQMANADSFGITFHGIRDYVGCHSFILPSLILLLRFAHAVASAEPVGFVLVGNSEVIAELLVA
jgi:hypothetical protein